MELIAPSPLIRRLPPNPVPVFYAGGDRIAALCGTNAVGTLSPEDWIGSTHAVGRPDVDDGVGIAVLDDGTPVTELLQGDAERWLGDRAQMGYLLKLLNPSDRIPVHWHPDARFARDHLGLANGKAESWVVLGAEPTEVWLGFTPTTDIDAIRGAVVAEDGAWLLSHMHHRTLAPGATVFVPPGLAHAIAPGALLLELQEPSSLSVLAEHSRFGVDVDRATLGTDWDTVLTCLRAPEPASTIDELIGAVPSGPGIWPLLTPGSRRFFSLRAVEVAGTITVPVNDVTVATVDRGRISISEAVEGHVVDAIAGTSWLVAASTGSVTLGGTGRVFLSSSAPTEARPH